MTEPMTQQELEEIRAAEQAATPGPWFVGRYSIDTGTSRFIAYPASDDSLAWNYDEDKEFVEMARTAVPRLLAEVERLTAERDAQAKRAEAAVSFLYRMADDPHWCDACKKCPCVEKGKVPLPGYCDFEWDGTDGKIEDRPCTDNTKGAAHADNDD
jgi:hypothetical protein